MPTGDGTSSAHNWRSLYEQAMLGGEEDGQALKRIERAENAIIERSRELAGLGFNEEDTELTGAILALCDARRRLRKQRAA